ncbi:hypothetical protein Nepgr_032454 [Nepenthes gracilis]|uniref:Uncharacterized protein n=1 Tax=Nepenthes gracilis TaxID=150966 RepID=A0AAD3TK23_NEPGR|nr:hypothetical protein Nepgr_032454 [Nepenthes gracilis]
MAQKIYTKSPPAVSAAFYHASSFPSRSFFSRFHSLRRIPVCFPSEATARISSLKLSSLTRFSVRCSEKPTGIQKTCKNCKIQFDPALNHPRACRFHTAHFGGETRRKFESVYAGGTMNTPNSGQVFHIETLIEARKLLSYTHRRY